MSETKVLKQPNGEVASPELLAPEQTTEHQPDDVVDPQRVRLFRGPRGVLRATIAGDRSVLRARVVRAFPISDRARYLSILDAKSKEVCLIEDPAQLDAKSSKLVTEALAGHYRISVITRIRSLRQEFRTMYWHVDTERGERDFVVKWSADTVIWLAPDSVQFEDVDGNRFVVQDSRTLDERSQKTLAVLR